MFLSTARPKAGGAKKKQCLKDRSVVVVKCWENYAKCLVDSCLGKKRERCSSRSMLTLNKAKPNSSNETTSPMEASAIIVRDAAALQRPPTLLPIFNPPFFESWRR